MGEIMMPFEGVCAAVKALSEHAKHEEVRRLLFLVAYAKPAGTRSDHTIGSDKQRGLVAHLARLKGGAREEWFDMATGVSLTQAHLGYLISYLNKEATYEEVKERLVDLAADYMEDPRRGDDGNPRMAEAFGCVEKSALEDTSGNTRPASVEYLKAALRYCPLEQEELEEFIEKALEAGITKAHADFIEDVLLDSIWQYYGQECTRCGTAVEDESDCLAFSDSDHCSWCHHQYQKLLDE
jgi:hypothetical protein